MIEIKSRRQLKDLLNWYEELLNEDERRIVITKIFQAYNNLNNGSNSLPKE